MSSAPAAPEVSPRPNRYGWVIVAACALMIFVTYGLIYSYSVFFKPLAAHFLWDRAAVSMVYSFAVVIRGASAIGIGWLADRYSARWVMVFCGLMMAAGYLLSSRVTGLGQFFLTYAVIEAIGMSGAWGICTAVPSRWFTKNRGMILGLVVAGSGLGTLLIVPLAERLVDAFEWSRAFVICGIGAGVLMVVSALFLRNPPGYAVLNNKNQPPEGVSVSRALGDTRFWLIILTFLFFFFGSQIIMVHLVNYATDVGIDPLLAATFVGVIGAVSVFSRISMGVASEKLGIYKMMLVTRLALVAVFVLLVFTRSVWAFYLIAALFGIPYGGEVTQIPFVIGRFFGTRNMATLMGISVFGINVGGAFGAWLAGYIFDTTDSYNWAFWSGAIAAVISLALMWWLRGAEVRKGEILNTKL